MLSHAAEVLTEHHLDEYGCSGCDWSLSSANPAGFYEQFAAHQVAAIAALPHVTVADTRIRDLEQQVMQSAVAMTFAELNIRTERRRADSFRQGSANAYDLKGWLRACADNPAGHAEFYQWASHYFFGTPEPEEG